MGESEGRWKLYLQPFLHLNVPEQCSSFSSNCVFHVLTLLIDCYWSSPYSMFLCSLVRCALPWLIMCWRVAKLQFASTWFANVIYRLYTNVLFFQDDTAFEKQSALFALAVSDIVMINLWVSISHITALLKVKILVSREIFNYYMICRWCHDIGREHAANRPLLRTVFQVILLLQWDTVILFSHVQSLIIICLFIKVLMRLFSPRKTTLLLVIRDKTKVCTVLGTESSFFLYFCSLIFLVCLTFLVFWFFHVFADSTRVPNTSSQGGY